MPLPPPVFLGITPSTAGIQVLVSASDSGGPKLGQGTRYLTPDHLQSPLISLFPLNPACTLSNCLHTPSFPFTHYTPSFFFMAIQDYQVGIQRSSNAAITSHHACLLLHAIPTHVCLSYTVLLSVPSKGLTSLLLHKCFAMPSVAFEMFTSITPLT